jgi:Zn/Cd-binding protein ZinT
VWMAVTTKLDVLPHVVNIENCKDKSLTGRSMEQWYNYYTLGYIHSVNLCKINDDEVEMLGCYMLLWEAEHIMD